MTFSRPPKLKTADDFISGAGTPVQMSPVSDREATVQEVAPKPRSTVSRELAAAEMAAPMPWEGKRSDKQTEIFNLRLTEVELEKLRFIAAHTPDSMQAFVRKVLLPAIDVKLNDLV